MFLFKLNPVGFHLLLIQQVFYVYCQCHSYYSIMLFEIFRPVNNSITSSLLLLIPTEQVCYRPSSVIILLFYNTFAIIIMLLRIF